MFVFSYQPGKNNVLQRVQFLYSDILGVEKLHVTGTQSGGEISSFPVGDLVLLN